MTSEDKFTLLKNSTFCGSMRHSSCIKATAVSKTPLFLSLKSERIRGTKLSIKSGHFRRILIAQSAAFLRRYGFAEPKTFST
jgi:hypothetical protein